MVESWPTAVSHMQAMVAGGPQGQRVSRLGTVFLVTALILGGGHSACACVLCVCAFFLSLVCNSGLAPGIWPGRPGGGVLISPKPCCMHRVMAQQLCTWHGFMAQQFRTCNGLFAQMFMTRLRTTLVLVALPGVCLLSLSDKL